MVTSAEALRSSDTTPGSYRGGSRNAERCNGGTSFPKCELNFALGRGRRQLPSGGMDLQDPRVDNLMTLIKDSFQVRPNQDPVYVDITAHD